VRGQYAKIILIGLMVTAFLVALPGQAQAAEGNKVVNFFKKILMYPFRVTKESAEVATDTTTDAVETVVKTGEASVGVVTGDIQQLDDVVVEPVKGAAKTTVTAVEGTVKMPIEAATEE